MKLIILALVLAGCATESKKSDPEPSKETFKPKKALEFNKGADYFAAKSSATNEALADESIFRVEKGELNSENSKDVINNIIILCYKKNFKEALELAKTHTSQFKKIPTFWNQVGTCYLLKGEERKALLYYNKALELSATYTPSLNNIGVIYSRKGQYQKALVAFQKAQQNARFSKTPRFNIAELYLSFGLVAEALPLFQSLLGDSPRDVDVLSGLANSNYLLGENNRAYELFSKIPDSHRSRADIGINFARSAFAIGKKEEAQAIISKVKNVPNIYKNYFDESQRKIEGN